MVVHALYRYPVKSLGGEQLQEAIPEERGFEDDRRWMLVDAAGQFITQRNHPALARFRAELLGESGLRIVRIADGTGVLETHQARPSGAPDTRVTVWDDTFLANLVSADPALGDALGCPRARLVYMSARSVRLIDPRYARGGETVSFADGYPYLLTTTGSLADLSERHGESLDMLRFRPNLVIRQEVPYAEDEWVGIAIGDHRFYLPKPCGRCIMITHSPETGERDLSVLAHLTQYRKRGNKVLFGVNAIWSAGSGPIRVGERVDLLG